MSDVKSLVLTFNAKNITAEAIMEQKKLFSSDKSDTNISQQLQNFTWTLVVKD